MGFVCKYLCIIMCCVYIARGQVAPQDGGFGAVTGSHHTRHALPISPRVDPATLTYPDLVTRVSAKAGSAIVFTEYMMHTTYPWTGSGQRKSIFYKYSARDRRVPTLAVHILTNPRYLARTYSHSLIAYRMFG